jgi:hypothetical protein
LPTSCKNHNLSSSSIKRHLVNLTNPSSIILYAIGFINDYAASETLNPPIALTAAESLQWRRVSDPKSDRQASFSGNARSTLREFVCDPPSLLQRSDKDIIQERCICFLNCRAGSKARLLIRVRRMEATATVLLRAHRALHLLRHQDLRLHLAVPARPILILGASPRI